MYARFISYVLAQLLAFRVFGLVMVPRECPFVRAGYQREGVASSVGFHSHGTLVRSE
ncbi:hypothetical protein KEU06_12355 [Pseudaminobacter sp. 19-2017]|uniref:Uncharacterized protein n=1 Tax=Pseudaminobacter soli (ex Zhang et al. 2022) TaxID=2831468 RepID=A0A942I8I3_9HYPH|nr:hypothetical protein [Pseudaminobacter soli]MBS3649400.1 hypothetical protein [Pseudaminobacter soli]